MDYAKGEFMEYNLNNRPKKYDATGKSPKTHKRNRYSAREIDVWFVGFEKQETKCLSNARIDLEKAKGSDARHCGFLAGYITAKKEILGET